jgi:nicotinamidase-related amidase
MRGRPPNHVDFEDKEQLVALNDIARRDDAVLVVVDIQERLAGAMERREQVAAASCKLMQTAALLGVPIVVTRQYPKGLGDLDASVLVCATELAERGAQIAHVDKLSFDCFGEPVFSAILADTQRRQLIVAGMESHICVTQTALSGLLGGYDVHVVADACCSRTAENHEVALARLRAAGAVVTTTESVLYELVGEAGTDEFRALLNIVKS